MTMIQRKFYLPDDMYNRLQIRAKIMGTTITETLRELIEKGLKQESKEITHGFEALLKLAKIAKKNKWSGPTDLSQKHDMYFAASKKAKKRIK